MTSQQKQPLSSVLFEQRDEALAQSEQRKPRIDLAFELTVLQCAIGCLTKDIPMSDADFLRMHLAITRLLRADR